MIGAEAAILLDGGEKIPARRGAVLAACSEGVFEEGVVEENVMETPGPTVLQKCSNCDG